MEKVKTESRLSIGKINGVEIAAVKHEKGEIYVPIKPICTALGIDFKVQHRKIEDDPSFSSVMVIMTTTGADGKQYDMVCLPIRRVYGWLYTINPGKVATEAREAVMKYRDQCNDILYDYFNGKTKRLEEFVNIERELMTRRETLQTSLSDLMKSVDSIKSEIKDIDKKFNDLKSERLNPTPSLFD